MTAPTDTSHALPQAAVWPLLAGYLSLIVLFGGFIAWSTTFEIASAIVVSGTVQVQSGSVVVQHVNGGMVGDILVRDGDRVTTGQLLLRLEPERQNAELAIIEARLAENMIRAARLLAEIEGRGDIPYPTELTELSAAPGIYDRLLENERDLHAATRTERQQDVALVARQTMQLNNRIAGKAARLTALRHQFSLTERLLADQQMLSDRGLGSATRLGDMEMRSAGLAGEIGQTTAEIAEMRDQIASIQFQLTKDASDQKRRALSELRDLRHAAEELHLHRKLLRDVITGLDLRSPTNGIVHASRVFSKGAVVQPGAAIMGVVPEDAPMVVALELRPSDIHKAFVGQNVSLHIGPPDRHGVQQIDGVIEKISPDALINEVTGRAYYAVEVALAAQMQGEEGIDQLLPGMPVQASIRTGDQTPLQYLVQPLLGYFGRAMRE